MSRQVIVPNGFVSVHPKYGINTSKAYASLSPKGGTGYLNADALATIGNPGYVRVLYHSEAGQVLVLPATGEEEDCYKVSKGGSGGGNVAMNHVLNHMGVPRGADAISRIPCMEEHGGLVFSVKGINGISKA